MKDATANSESALAVKRWIEQFVAGLNLCPFARRELEQDRVRVVSTSADSAKTLRAALLGELRRLDGDLSIETTVLVHPEVFADFLDYNDFLQQVDDLLLELKLDGIYQVASFHPSYQFADTSPDDAENYTNRSPYPLLHILREASVEQAIDSYPDVAAIPERNIESMNKLGAAALRAQLAEYLGPQNR